MIITQHIKITILWKIVFGSEKEMQKKYQNKKELILFGCIKKKKPRAINISKLIFL